MQHCPSTKCRSGVHLFKIKSNPMHLLRCALPPPYVPERVTRGALVALRRSQLRLLAVELLVIVWDWRVLTLKFTPSIPVSFTLAVFKIMNKCTALLLRCAKLFIFSKKNSLDFDQIINYLIVH